MAKKKLNGLTKAHQQFAPPDLAGTLRGYNARLRGIARAVRPGDEMAIEMYAEQLANEIVRAYFRGVAAEMRAAKLAAVGCLDADDDNAQRLADQGMPDPNTFRTLVGQIQQLIRDEIKVIGNSR